MPSFTTPEPGDRVRLISMISPRPIPAGSEGRVVGVIAANDVYALIEVDWDSDEQGQCMCIPQDKYEKLDALETD